ncbi:MAG: hypothetical protein PHY93_18920 [Bacteriovorax sp.]|nr:hypothetical protein [Bacteriovorax sp.]
MRETDKIIGQIFNCVPKTINKVIISERLNAKLERLKKNYGEKSHEELFEILVDEKLMDQKTHSEKKDEHVKKY